MRNLQEFKKISAASLDDLHHMRQAAKHAMSSMHISYQNADMLFVHRMCQEVVEINYDLGKVIEVEEVFGGYMSRSFRLYMEKDGVHKKWFFRRYKNHKDLTELKLEHKVLLWAKEHGNTLVAAPLYNKKERTYVRYDFTNLQGVVNIVYFAVYEYLEGNDSYTWLDNELEPHTSRSTAQAMAMLHNSVRDFESGELNRAEPPIFELLPTIPEEFHGFAKTYAEAELSNLYTRYFDEHLPYYQHIVDKVLTIITPDIQKNLLVCPIQGDFHPGNFKYDDDGYVAGIFDFDWASVDYRMFELGLGLVYTFGSWQDGQDGHLYLDALIDWMIEYDKTLRQTQQLEPLTQTEKEHLPEMLLVGYLYLARWCATSVALDTELNPFEYLSYLRHITCGLNWVEQNTELIRQKMLSAKYN